MFDNGKYEWVIGLEVHVQLLTNSKLFCGDSTQFGSAPNSQISPITLAHPGTLPRMNKRAIDHAVTLGLALNCDIEQHNYFARKNYFYPDLPKGYQISQHTTPICRNGFVKIKTGNSERNVRLNRIHIEEDAGKSLHDADEKFTAIDLNRAGTALLEIVSEPDMHSAEEAFAYMTALRKLVRWLSVCDGNMEEGSMRCDVNISIRKRGEEKLGTKVEIKNLNSIRNMKRAIEYEAQRLQHCMEDNETILQETRSFDADKGTTFSLRSKEDADDYRYFPEPDLTPFVISDEYITKIKSEMPEMPEVMKQSLVSKYGISDYDAGLICEDIATMEYFIDVIVHTHHYKAAANWMIGPVKNYLNENDTNIESFPLKPAVMASLVDLVENGKTGFSMAATKIFPAILKDNSRSALEWATELNLLQESDNNAIEDWVQTVIEKMPDKVKEYQNGKKGLIGLFAGEVKKLSKGKADMQLTNKILMEKLKSDQ